ncbi:hypothetical protein [uncultured Aquimarina sp.]|uniref:hypothetical protein n=1 Tax=uncultured Aquimarina sp. TaxID=575652 RepID=UPI002608AD4F|nr:hypothetical protein [uncultured Aquimarina sp.]
MVDNINFKKLWDKQQIEIPETKELIKKANKFKKNTFYKLVIANALLVITSIFIGFVWYYYQPRFMITKIGLIICIIAMIIYLAFHNTLTPLLLKNNLELDAKLQLKQLLMLKEKQRFQQTYLLNIYFILLSLGLSLYMYEYVAKMTLSWAIISYGIVLFWVGLNAFYFRPKILKKQQAKLNILITRFKELNEQLID